MTTMSIRRPSRTPLMATLAAVAGIAFGVGVAQAADQRLADADNALQKAAALLEASETGGVSPKAQKQFDKAVSQALEDIADARVHIVEAQTAADSP